MSFCLDFVFPLSFSRLFFFFLFLILHLKSCWSFTCKAVLTLRREVSELLCGGNHCFVLELQRSECVIMSLMAASLQIQMDARIVCCSARRLHPLQDADGWCLSPSCIRTASLFVKLALVMPTNTSARILAGAHASKTSGKSAFSLFFLNASFINV